MTSDDKIHPYSICSYYLYVICEYFSIFGTKLSYAYQTSQMFYPVSASSLLCQMIAHAQKTNFSSPDL